MVLPNEFFEKVNLEKISKQQQKHDKLPSMQNDEMRSNLRRSVIANIVSSILTWAKKIRAVSIATPNLMGLSPNYLKKKVKHDSVTKRLNVVQNFPNPKIKILADILVHTVCIN